VRLSSAIKLLPRCLGKSGLLNRRGIIFMFGHMRCYSSLLSHMIGSHPQVAGYAEMRQKYRNALDLIELAAKIESSTGSPPTDRYHFDKILLDFTVRDRVLRRGDLSVIVTSRLPEPTIRSIVKLAACGILTPNDAIEYYVGRMKTLQQIVERRKGRAIYLDAEAVIERPSDTLHRLSGYLGLMPDISENYQMFSKTGVGKYGDPSPWIKSGKIVKVRDQTSSPEPLPPEIDKAITAHGELREFCSRHAEATIMV